jgi:small subunit ribosomal protein S16
MVKIRLTRVGRKNVAMYHIVATDVRSPRNGRVIERLGLYDPRRRQAAVEMDRVFYWLGVGAKLTETAEQVLDKFAKGAFREGFKPTDLEPPFRMKRGESSLKS